MKSARKPARVVALLGASQSGRSTLVRGLKAASKKSVVIVTVTSETLPDDMLADIERQRAYADVVFVDAISTPLQLKALWDTGVVDSTKAGTLAQVTDMSEGLPADLRQCCELYSMPCVIVPNVRGNLEGGLLALAQVAGLRS